MKQQLITLSAKTKGIIIPNTILKHLGDPDAFDMEISEGKIILKPLKKGEKPQKVLGDESLDLYKVD